MKEDILEIQIHENKYVKCAEIKPLGFWARVVTVYQERGLRAEKFNEAYIRWSSGGTDGTISNQETVKNFISALNKGLKIAEKWNKEVING